MADLILGDNQQVALGPLKAVDKAGNDAPFQNSTFVSSDPTIVAVTDNGDGTALAVATGLLGSATVTASADADMGDGVTTISADPLSITVQAESATGLNMGVGVPVEKP